MIQEFLTNNLIQITEDENVDKLLKASVSLEKKLTKSKNKIPTFVLIAFDPEINPTNPDVLDVQQLIIDNWKTFTSNCKDTPLTYIRAVIFETLEKLSADINLANLIWLSSKNIQKYLKLKGKEKDLIIGFLNQIGNKIEEAAIDNYSISKTNNLKEIKIELTKLQDVTIDNVKLETSLMAAISHSGWGQGGQNPHWNDVNWTKFLSKNAANGISEILKSVLVQQNTHIEEKLNKIQESIKNIVTKLLLNNNNSLNLRTELLWWKEACYSGILKASYKEIPKGLLEIILAIDYSEFIPYIYPQSVNYFLKETHIGITIEEDNKMKISEILKLIDDKKELLKQYIADSEIESERILLFDFIRGIVFNKFSIKEIKKHLGITETTELTLSEFTLWLFHDVQVINFLKK
ncbi:MAG: hypothetical protein KUL78_07970 [Flavobacterium sp.]|nr:hypothetical protein [Flavobacterium sp.]